MTTERLPDSAVFVRLATGAAVAAAIAAVALGWSDVEAAQARGWDGYAAGLWVRAAAGWAAVAVAAVAVVWGLSAVASSLPGRGWAKAVRVGFAAALLAAAVAVLDLRLEPTAATAAPLAALFGIWMVGWSLAHWDARPALRALAGSPPAAAGLPLAAVLVAAMAWGGVAWRSGGPEPAADIDVVLLSVPGLRADAVGAYGSGDGWTPAIDAWSQNALVFDQVLAASSAPHAALGSVLASDLPFTFPFQPEAPGPAPVTASERTLLAQLLHAHGWQTVAVDTGSPTLAEQGLATGYERIVAAGGPRDAAAAAAQVVADAGPGRLFLHVHLTAARFPLEPAAALTDIVEYTGPVGQDPAATLNLFAHAMTAADLDFVRRVYGGTVRRIDRAVGRVLAAVAERGRPTLTVLAAPHGLALGEPPDRWFGTSQHLKRPLTAVPLIVSAPGGKTGRVVSQVVSTLDIVPTIGRRAGATVGGDYVFVGRAFDLSAGRPLGVSPQPVFSETQFGDRWLRAARFGPYKLIRDLRTNTIALHHLPRDPDERRNVAAAHPEAAGRLLDALNDWLARVTLWHHWPMELEPTIAPEGGS